MTTSPRRTRQQATAFADAKGATAEAQRGLAAAKTWMPARPWQAPPPHPPSAPSPPAEKGWGRRTLDVRRREFLFSRPHDRTITRWVCGCYDDRYPYMFALVLAAHISFSAAAQVAKPALIVQATYPEGDTGTMHFAE